MTQPVTSPSTPQAFISEVGQYDKRAQESLQQALDTLQKQANTLQQAHALTRTITHLQQFRPELADQVHQFLGQFPQVHLRTASTIFEIAQPLLYAESEPLYTSLTRTHFHKPQQVDCSDCEPEVISLLCSFLEKRPTDRLRMLYHTEKLLELADRWLLASLNEALGSFSTSELSALDDETIITLIKAAKTYHNLLLYVVLLKYCSQKDTLLTLVDSEDRAIIQESTFKNIVFTANYVIVRVESLSDLKLYTLLADFGRTSSGGKLCLDIQFEDRNYQPLNIAQLCAAVSQHANCQALKITHPDSTFSTLIPLLEPLRCLESLHLDGFQIDVHLKDLLSQHSLKELQLTHCKISDQQALDIGNYLQDAPQLSKLILDNNSISATGICSIMQHMQNLQTLSLSHNPLGDQGGVELAKRLNDTHTLEELTLTGCIIGDEGACALFAAIEKKPLIYELNISENPMGELSFKALSTMLRQAVTLEFLDLSKTGCSDLQATAIAESLIHACSLVYLNLSNNPISDQAANALANVIKKGSSLTTLSLIKTNITDPGARSLIDATKHNTQFELLDLQFTETSDDIKALADTLDSVVI